MKFSGNKRNNLFILIRTFPVVVLLQNATMNRVFLYMFDVLEAICFLIFSVEGFVSYLRMTGKTQFHFIS